MLMCQKEHRVEFCWPWSVENVLLFVHWLVAVRNVKEGTVKSYLSGVRQLHVTKGLDVPNLRPDVVKLILKGKKNMDAAASRMTEQNGRQPMTVDLMKTLKEEIRLWDKPWNTRLLVWCVCTLAFHGAFRIHEILCKTESFFDPDYTLLTEDVTMTTDKAGKRTIHVKLKSPKEQKGKHATIVDVFESGNSLCPVKAFIRWKARQNCEIGSPLFRDIDGTPLTGKKINTIMKKMLKGESASVTGKYSSHSFRMGIASLLGSEGFEDDEIKAAGRWSSRAFETYVKTDRTKRASMGRAIAKIAK
jgi:hypothetical protein